MKEAGIGDVGYVDGISNGSGGCFFFYLLQPPGGCKGMCLLDCKAINQSIGVSNHHKEIGAPPPHRPEP